MLNRFRSLGCCLLAVLVSVSCMACSSEIDTSPYYNPQTDCQYYNCGFAGIYTLAETEDSIYYIDEFYLHAIDKQTMQDIIVCSKPDCLHDKGNSTDLRDVMSCDAYFFCNADRLTYHDGYLYVVQETLRESIGAAKKIYLTQVSLDGANRKNLWEIEWKEDFVGSIMQVIMHRGKAYFVIDEEPKPEDGVAYTRIATRILSYDLKTKKSKWVYRCERGSNEIKLIGNYLYARSLSESGTEYQYHRCNLSTGETTVWKDCYTVLPVGEKLLIYYLDDQEGEKVTYRNRLTTLNLQTEKEEPYELIDCNGETFEMCFFQSDGTRLFVLHGLESHKITVHDFSTGEELAVLEVPAQVDEWLDDGYMMSLTQNGKLLIYSRAGADVAKEFFYCNISDIGTDNFQWYEVEKVN